MDYLYVKSYKPSVSALWTFLMLFRKSIGFPSKSSPFGWVKQTAFTVIETTYSNPSSSAQGNGMKMLEEF